MYENLSRLKEDILEIMWQTPDFDAAMYAALKLTGTCFDADSVYITECNDDNEVFQNTFVWHSPSLEEPAKKSYVDDVSKLYPLIQIFESYQNKIFWSADDMSAEAAFVLQALGVSSVLQTPVRDGERTCAYFGITDYHVNREDWQSDQEVQRALLSISKIIGVFLLKTRYAQHSKEVHLKLKESLKASEQRANTAYELLDSISAGVIIVQLYPDGSARPQYGNLGMYRILDIPRTAENSVVPDRNVANLEGEYFDDFFANIPEPDNIRVRREYREGFKMDHFSVKKYRLMRGDGTYVWVTADLSLYEATPLYRTYYATYTDMSEEQGLLTGLAEMLENEKEITAKLEKASRAKSDFLSRMSHDIRTPMNAIMGMTTIAKAHLDSRDRVADCLGKIDSSSKLLLNIINEVLDMSKIESGRIALTEEEVNFADLVNDVVTMVQPQINEKELYFNVRISDVSHEVVIGDKQRLQQILLNLLSNAVKYTNSGGSVLLEISEEAGEGGVSDYKFVVADSGIGMTPEFMQKIFLPFERADDEKIKLVQGTGLGLSICKSVATLMGGSIAVESEYGKGSRFTATVRLQVQENAADYSELASLPVLIVDDDEIVCRNACKVLESVGVKAEWVLDGMSAIDKVVAANAAGNDYFAVILDLKMPRMDGIETARHIRQSLGYSIPIIMISAYDYSEYLDQAKLAGVDSFIMKPLFRSRLLYKLMQFLGTEKNETPKDIFSQPRQPYAGRRILLVEDNELNREIAVELISVTGATVETAENGQVALDMVAASSEGYYDLIFMDIQMPIMDGCTAACKIRGLNRHDSATVPIIAMTANAFADDRQRTKDAGMNEHLAKPIDIKQLNHALQQWL